MPSSRRTAALHLAALLLLGPRVDAKEIPLAAWPVPSGKPGPGAAPLADAGYPGVFVPFSPCRLVDTRNAAGPYGGPKLGAAASRSFDLNSHPTCTGIPYGVAAYSLNFTVTETDGPGYLTVYPTGGSPPLVSTVNYVGGQTIANAAVVPADEIGQVTVLAGVSGTHVVIDVNGYFMGFGGYLNAGQILSIAGSNLEGPVLYARNRAVGPAGSPLAASISGLYGATGQGQGVLGRSEGSTGVLFGVRGEVQSFTDGAAGVKGTATSSSGRVHGVLGGASSSTDCAAGVAGEWGSSLPCTFAGTAGVLGTGRGFWGVLGLTDDSGGRGVQGARVDGAGIPVTSGVLGHVGTSGVHSFHDITAAGTKSFVEPHPTDPSRQIVYVALEGPEAGTYFRGRGTFAGGKALIAVPEDFRIVTSADGLTCQLTPIGKAVAVGVTRLSLEGIEVEATGDVEFSYLVQGVRRPYEGFRPLQENVLFVPAGPDARIDPWPPHVKQRLVDVGIYDADGTPNLDTARRLGWKAAWDEAKAKVEAYQRVVQEELARENAADPQGGR